MAGPNGIAAGLTEPVVTEYQGNNIGKISPSTGVITEYAIPTLNNTITTHHCGSDGSMWFALDWNIKSVKSPRKRAQLLSIQLIINCG